MGLSLEFLLAGQGIAVLHKQLAEKFEQVGAVIHILPEWTCLGFEAYLLRPEGLAPRRIQLFIDHIVEHFQSLKQSPKRLIQNISKILIECPLCSCCHKNGHQSFCRP